MAHIIEKLADDIVTLNYNADHSRFADYSRFAPISVNHTYDIIKQQKNINTKRQTACHVNFFKNWLKENAEIRDPHLI